MKPIKSNFDPYLFEDILSDKTRKVRRNLIIVAFATFFILYPDVKIKNAFVDLTPLGDDAKLLAAFASFLIVSYLFIVFEMYRSLDYRVWSGRKIIKELNKLESPTIELRDVTKKVVEDIRTFSVYLEPKEETIQAFSFRDSEGVCKLPTSFEDAKNIINSSIAIANSMTERFELASSKIDNLGEVLQSTSSELGKLSEHQLFTHKLIDIGIPRLLGIFSLVFTSWVFLNNSLA